MDKNYAGPDADYRNATNLEAPSPADAGRQDSAMVGQQDRAGQADNSEGGLPRHFIRPFCEAGSAARACPSAS
jgi:hypothetical protein